MDDFKLYAILNTETNKFVTDLTNPRHKFWTSKKRAMSALNTANALQLFRLGKYKRENLARNNIEIDHFEFKIAYNGIEFVYLKGIAFDTNGDTIKNFQTVAEYSKKGIVTIEQYKKLKIKELSDYFGYQYDGPISIDDFSISMSLDFAKNNSDKFSYSPELLKIKTNELNELEK